MHEAERSAVWPSPEGREITHSLRLFNVFRLLATSYLYVPIFMLFQAARGLSFFERLALGGIFSAVVIVVEVPTGVFADRLGRRRSMVLGALAMVASCLIAARAHSFAAFALAEALAALSIALCSGADSAYLYDLLCAHDRGHEYGRRESAASAYHLLGSALAYAGGGLLAQVDLALPYLVTAGVAAVAAGVACLLHEERPVDGRARSSLGAVGVERRLSAVAGLRSWSRQLTAALREVGNNARLLWIVGYSAVVFVLLRATVYLYQPYLEERGLGPVAIGLLFAGVYVVSSVVAFRTYQLRRRFGDELLLWGVLVVLVASFVGLAGATRGPWMLALLVVQAIANGIYSPLTKPLLNAEIADSRHRAAVLSVDSMARRVAMGVFAPLAGLWGQADVMLLCGAVGIAGLAVLLLARARVRAAGVVDEAVARSERG